MPQILFLIDTDSCSKWLTEAVLEERGEESDDIKSALSDENEECDKEADIDTRSFAVGI